MIKNNKTHKQFVINKLFSIKHESDTKHSIDAVFHGMPYLLLPVTDASVKDDTVVSLLARWRKNHEHWFPAKFMITFPGTQKWLYERVINVEDRLLFLLKVHNHFIGHVGLFRFDYQTRECELDNIVRGEEEYPGILGHAVMTMMEWGKTALMINRYTLQTASDNERALRFYNRLGFVETHRVPLVHIKRNDGWYWEDAPLGFKGKTKRYNVFMMHKSNT